MRAALESTLDPTVSTSSARLDLRDHAPVLACLRGQGGRDGHSRGNGLADPPATPADNVLLDLSAEDGEHSEGRPVAQEGYFVAINQRPQGWNAAGCVSRTVGPALGLVEKAALADAPLQNCDL